MPKARKSKKLPIAEEELNKIASIINPSDSSVYYFGVRHHSPVASYFLTKIFAKFNPDLVLIEGPADAEYLIEDIINQKSQPPIAIHTYFSDKRNSLGYNGVLTPKEEIPLRISSWYPFTEYSPEYVALKLAAERGNEVHFIDLPLQDRLKFEKEIANDKSFFQKYSQWSERYLSESLFMERITKKSGMRSFNEFWNHNFEINAFHNSLEEYLQRVLTFAYTLRWFSEQNEEYPTWKTIVEREKYMARNIDYYRTQNPDKKILVITGAMHTVSLPFIKLKGKKGKIPKEKSSALAPYSYKRISDLSGYTAGIESPYYQSLVWDKIHQNNGQIYNEIALNVLINIKEELKGSNSFVSTADIMNAYHMAKNLASLRSRHQISLEDLRDAITASYIKGDIEIFGFDVIREAQRILIGSKVGSAFNSEGNPLQKDFYQQLKKLRLPKEDKTKNVRCEIYKRETHRMKSQFLHQLHYLNISYGKLEKGPDYIAKKNLELLTEQWRVRWSPYIDDAFPKLLPYGISILNVARNKLEEQIGEKYNSLEELLNYLVKALQMGFLDLFEDLIDQLNKRVNYGQSFTSIIRALSAGILLLKYRTSLITKYNKLVENFVYVTFTGATSKLKELIQLPEDEIEEAVLSLRILNQISLDYDLEFISAEILTESIGLLLDSSQKIVPRVEGAFIGLLFSHNKISEEEIVNRFKGRIHSNENIQGASEFLIGLFLLNKTVLITSDKLLEVIHTNLMQIKYELFLTILPGLRKAFTSLIPREIDYISSKLAKLIGIKPELDLGLISPEALSSLKEIDEQINNQLQEEWGL
ncbi:MAG: hypothetical protein BAJALOKI1v1_1040010 [Promethearchaeota archaeon]|nr:MAG: hypothetical protein BAJALOKI1v1_1040010 [Candidatus Lokiarchaeota archaeon]